MSFRITQQHSMNMSIRQAQIRQSAIGALYDQIGTGLRINKPSDAPSEWGHLIGQKSSVERMGLNLENISTARQRLNQSVSTLTEAGNLLVRARELALSGPQSQEREILALEVDKLIDGLLSISNASEGGLYLYSGTASNQIPFEVTSVDQNGRPQEIRYLGAHSASDVLVGPDTTAEMLPAGDEVFQQSQREKTLYLGSTGAAAGIGTDSAVGVGHLTVRNTGTSYASFLQPGLSAATEDTIVGTHAITIEDDPNLGRTVRLNEGGKIPFDASATDLRVSGPNGETVFVDMSALPANFSGEIEITATGTLSLDSGETEVPIDFSTQSQILTDPNTGRVTVVDSTGIRRTGKDRLEYQGTNGAFEALMQLRDDLRNSDDLSTPDFVAVMQSRISDIQRAHSQTMEFVGEQAVELSNLETLELRTREIRLMTSESVTEIENADMADVISQLQTQQTQLQFIYAAAASLNQTSLLDFI